MTPPRLPKPRRAKPHSTESRGTESRGTESRGTESRGTEPRRTEPRRTEQRAVKLATDETAVRSWLRGLRLSGFSFVMMGLLVLAVVVLAPSVRTYAEQRKQIDQLSDTVAAQQDSVDDLKAERERWNDRTFVTTQARDRLSYVLPGDISFLVINDSGASVDDAADTAPISTAIQDTEVDWVDSVFRSVMTSALAPQEAAQ
ncbi:MULTISPECIES: septum formation initiator family protein [unclassified Cryobacterium]|uniref:FtsB family cell division protein n=1 Tax=unclassified Cryobacterium TaxID=2649013 RepID=UPI00106C807E|nr:MULTISPECIES: septum formation initiator family protein [unclassified Cryobacterium]TFC50978.1 septum formation initiator family protein [Cryobacterium sp. TMB3-1-2]TFC74324.1 septum formation initiator family protein [Cryobacterium sp. TMB3-15]TFC79837.1 septum formation initiator family protein [Cryobacterium sp. TMB3-10]TFD40788.1 septum formation initiator family protein [Cryobacterium sp. TMB3-12]